MMQRIVTTGVLLMGLLAAGCAPVVVGGATVGAYKVGGDERTAGRIMDDVALTAAVNRALVEDADVRARKIDVDSLEGVVTLTGVVGSEEERNRALAITSKVAGVVRVVDNLQIGLRGFGQRFADSNIASKIKLSLMGEPGVRSMNIDVDVFNGVVSLTGIVSTEDQKTRAVALARQTEGVVRVVDNITVKQ